MNTVTVLMLLDFIIDLQLIQILTSLAIGKVVHLPRSFHLNTGSAVRGYPGEGRPDAEALLGAKLPFGGLPGR